MAIQNALGGIIRKMLMALGDDATGDTFYTDPNGEFENRAIGTLGQVYTVQEVGGDLLPGWDAAPYGPMPTNVITGASSGMNPNERIIIARSAVSGLCTLTLPETAAVGSVIPICGQAQDSFRIAQNADQLIVFNGNTTTTGVGGYIQSRSPNDTLTLVCLAANIRWQVVNPNGSGFDVE